MSGIALDIDMDDGWDTVQTYQDDDGRSVLVLAHGDGDEITFRQSTDEMVGWLETAVKDVVDHGVIARNRAAWAADTKKADGPLWDAVVRVEKALRPPVPRDTQRDPHELSLKPGTRLAKKAQRAPRMEPGGWTRLPDSPVWHQIAGVSDCNAYNDCWRISFLTGRNAAHVPPGLYYPYLSNGVFQAVCDAPDDEADDRLHHAEWQADNGDDAA